MAFKKKNKTKNIHSYKQLLFLIFNVTVPKITSKKIYIEKREQNKSLIYLPGNLKE